MVRQNVSIAINLLIQIGFPSFLTCTPLVLVCLYIGHSHSVFFFLSPRVFLARIIQQDNFDA